MRISNVNIRKINAFHDNTDPDAPLQQHIKQIAGPRLARFRHQKGCYGKVDWVGPRSQCEAYVPCHSCNAMEA